MKKVTFFVAGLCCPSEEQLIRNRLRTVAGIDSLAFNTLQKELTVNHGLDDTRPILDALNGLGMEASLKDAGSPAGGGVPRSLWIAIAVSGVAAAVAEGLAIAGVPESSPLVIGLSLLSIAVGGRETLKKGLLALRTRTLNINFLMTLAIVGALCIGQWPEAAMVTFLFGVAERVEAFSLDRARNAIRGLMEMTPEVALIRDEDGLWRQVSAREVAHGQLVRVRPGERVPLDGVVRVGGSTVNQAPITGESMPVEKAPGDPVFAGTINERGTFDFEVTGRSGETTLDRIVQAVQQAQAERAPTQRFIDRFAHYYTPAVVALAALVAAVPPLVLAQPFLPWLYKALVLLVIACPCALVISTPVTVVSGLAAAARRGILIKGGVYLEQGRKLQAVALDKTGTITLGRPALTDVVPLGGRDSDAVLRLAASLDAPSEHPVASAITAAGLDQELLPVEDFEAIAGRGVRGRIEGVLHFVGNHRLAHENGVCTPETEAALARLEQAGKTAVVLTTEREALAVLGVADTLRETSAEAVRALHEMGVRTVMLTGDNQTTARAIADQVGIGDARGDLLPEDKLAAVTELRDRYGVVGMVGDGINDAPALARADIGFAMGAAGTDTALETADVALMQDDLRKLPEFVRLSRQAAAILAQNIAIAVGIKVVFFTLAFAGVATLWMAVFADMGGSLLVVFNGLRLLRGGKTPPAPPAASGCCGSSSCGTSEQSCCG